MGLAETARTALRRVSERRRSDRAGMRLALRTWRRNAHGGEDVGRFVSSGGVGELQWEAGELKLLAGVSVEAATAFSAVDSVRRSWGGVILMLYMLNVFRKKLPCCQLRFFQSYS